MTIESELKKNGGGSFSVELIQTVLLIALLPGVFYLCNFVFAKAPEFSETQALAISGLICALAIFGVLSLLIQRNISKSTAALILFLSLTADIGLNILIRDIEATHYGSTWLHYYALINLALLGIAWSGGVLLSGVIKKASYLIPLVVAAGIADIWSVGWGVTSEIVKSKTAMNYLLFSFPVAGKEIIPLIGVTDFVFATLFLMLAHRFKMPIITTRILLASAFILAIAVAVWCGIGVPVLPVMGVLFIIGNYKHVKITDPKEKKDAVLGIIIIVTALAVATLIK